jgi:hypothetical protein
MVGGEVARPRGEGTAEKGIRGEGGRPGMNHAI